MSRIQTLRKVLPFALLSFVGPLSSRGVAAPDAAQAPERAIEIFTARPAPPKWWSRSGEKWSAVFHGHDSKYEVKSVESKIYVNSRDGVIRLGAQNSPDPLFFISGVELPEGEVKRVVDPSRLGQSVQMDDTLPVDLSIGDQKWKLSRQTLSVKGATHDYMEARVRYRLESDGRPTLDLGETTCRIPIRKSAIAKTCQEKILFHFVGDLDGDEVPDLYFNQIAASGTAVENAHLYLSLTKTFTNLSAQISNQTGSGDDTAYKAIVRKAGEPDPGVTAEKPEIASFPETTGPPSRPKLYSFDSWIGVFPASTPSHSATRRAAPRLENVKLWVGCPASQCGEKERVETTALDHPLFLLRGLKGVESGSVVSARIQPAKVKRKVDADDRDEDAFASYRVSMAGQSYELSGASGVYTLTRGKLSKKLELKTEDPDNKPNLLWAGDLNHDGKLDLYFSVKQDDSVAYLLFVSPEVGPPSAPPTARSCSGECP